MEKKQEAPQKDTKEGKPPEEKKKEVKQDEIPKTLAEKANKRQAFYHNNNLVYEWDQTIDEVNIYIKPPKYVLKKYEDEVRKNLKPGQKMPKLEIKIDSKHVKISITDQQPYINDDLSSIC